MRASLFITLTLSALLAGCATTPPPRAAAPASTGALVLVGGDEAELIDLAIDLGVPRISIQAEGDGWRVDGRAPGTIAEPNRNIP